MLIEKELMIYGDLNEAMGWQSLDAGNEKKWTPKFGWRATANAVNGMCPQRRQLYI